MLKRHTLYIRHLNRAWHCFFLLSKKVKAVYLLVLLANTNWNVFVYFIAEVYSIIN